MQAIIWVNLKNIERSLTQQSIKHKNLPLKIPEQAKLIHGGAKIRLEQAILSMVEKNQNTGCF